jgi:MSHA biogenesis protein MshJ
MKRLIQRYAERIDAATLRQRLLAFLFAAFALLLLGNALLIEPLRAKHKRLAAENAQSQKELGLLQAELARVAGIGSQDPDAAKRKRQAALRVQLAEVNARIAREERRFTAPDRMRLVLEQMLERNKNLTLLELRTLPAAPVAVRSQGASAGGMYRHSVELTIRGTYGDLYDYLRSLEKLPGQLYWARAELVANAHPILTLKLTVHTISFDRAWLIV